MPAPFDEILNRPLRTLAVGQRETIVCRLDADDLNNFIEVSGDRSPIHSDEAYARERGFAGRVVHGALLGALVSRLVGHRLPGALGVMQTMELEFRRPVTVPTELTLSGEITNVSASTGQVTLTVKIMNTGGDLCALARVRSIVRPEILP